MVKCKEWTGNFNNGGYGYLSHKHGNWLAHRLAWSLANGKNVPKGKLVCHHCDNRKCIEPQHLFIGTNQDNFDDMRRKGRQPDYKSYLGRPRRITEENIAEVNRLRKMGIAARRACREVGISHQQYYGRLRQKT